MRRFRQFLVTPTTALFAVVILHWLIVALDLPELAHANLNFEELTLAASIVLFAEFSLRINKRQASKDLRRTLKIRVDRHREQLRAASDALARENDERKRIERDLIKESTLDPLTGLANRRSVLLSIDERLEKQEMLVAVYFIDIDHFKLINDGLGDEVADRALVVVGSRIAKLAPPGSLVGRVAGDEFALVTNVATEHQAAELAENLVGILKNPIAIDDRLIYSSTSIGVRVARERNEASQTLLRDAHTAMHRSKSNGRGRFTVFDNDMHTDALQRFQLTTDLRQAVEQNEFIVEYQPIYSLSTGIVSGYEALVRWEHPQRGRVQPDVFIPAAEDNGLVVAIGAGVLRNVCREISERKLTISTPIGVNLSARQIAQADIVETITGCINEYGIPPASLVLEVTESVFIESLGFARGVLARLKELGIQISIDDFGTGYSSLSYLSELPFDVLKIDRSFIRRIDHDKASQDIVRMLVVLADSLHMVVVAEGIETVEQLAKIRELGCQKGQGYLFAHPVAADVAFTLPSVKTLLL